MAATTFDFASGFDKRSTSPMATTSSRPSKRLFSDVAEMDEHGDILDTDNMREDVRDAPDHKRRLTESIHEKLRQLNISQSAPRAIPSGHNKLPNRFDFSGPVSMQPPPKPEPKRSKRSRGLDDELLDPDAELDSLLRPMKRLRLADPKKSSSSSSSGSRGAVSIESVAPTPSSSPVQSAGLHGPPSTPRITVSEPREDSDREVELEVVPDGVDLDDRLLVPQRHRIHPQALEALARQSSLLRLRPPPVSPDNSRALVPYGSAHGSILHAALVRYLAKQRREDEPSACDLDDDVDDPRPRPSVRVESVSSSDDESYDGDGEGANSDAELMRDADVADEGAGDDTLYAMDLDESAPLRDIEDLVRDESA